MRELVITQIRNSKFYENLFDETEGNPPSLEAYTDEVLLDLYVRYC